MHISHSLKDFKYSFIQKHKGDTIAFLDYNWKNIVKNPLKSYPYKLNTQKLYIKCSNNGEKFILFNQQYMLLNKINELFPENIIKKIVFT